MTWTSSGPPITGHRHAVYYLDPPSYIITYNLNGVYRQAKATGTVSYGPTNFATDPSHPDFTQIWSRQSGMVTITKP